ncbi:MULTISPECIES: hypothetical protein [unclassified Psychrobacter]|uniref:hypothetical protein n=1 Tax=unclassified Psychrobacter TaxID=196806 RepID=UPI0025F59E41|nr:MULTISPECIES: hypothetical protein [unclassified Psychrobacter]
MKNNINTSSTADINFSCLLCLRRQRLQKIDISNTAAFLGYFDYKLKQLFKKTNIFNGQNIKKRLSTAELIGALIWAWLRHAEFNSCF